MKQLLLISAFLLSINTVLADEQDGVLLLPDEPTEVQIQMVRDGAKERCSELEEDGREECVMDYYAQHNLEEEPSCD
jgi:hypothetical protein